MESGVVLTPLGKYRDFNIRICRPHQLTASDRQQVLNYALAHVGNTYDLKNLLDLARYFLPVSIVPPRWRRKALEFGSTDPTRVICSSLIAESFARVRFPIVPQRNHRIDAHRGKDRRYSRRGQKNGDRACESSRIGRCETVQQARNVASRGDGRADAQRDPYGYRN